MNIIIFSPGTKTLIAILYESKNDAMEVVSDIVEVN